MNSFFNLPFYGLGLNLDPLLERSQTLKLTPIHGKRQTIWFQNIPITAGIDLLIYLNRETRGS